MFGSSFRPRVLLVLFVFGPKSSSRVRLVEIREGVEAVVPFFGVEAGLLDGTSPGSRYKARQTRHESGLVRDSTVEARLNRGREGRERTLPLPRLLFPRNTRLRGQRAAAAGKREILVEIFGETTSNGGKEKERERER